MQHQTELEQLWQHFNFARRRHHRCLITGSERHVFWNVSENNCILLGTGANHRFSSLSSIFCCHDYRYTDFGHVFIGHAAEGTSHDESISLQGYKVWALCFGFMAAKFCGSVSPLSIKPVSNPGRQLVFWQESCDKYMYTSFPAQGSNHDKVNGAISL